MTPPAAAAAAAAAAVLCCHVHTCLRMPGELGFDEFCFIVRVQLEEQNGGGQKAEWRRAEGTSAFPWRQHIKGRQCVGQAALQQQSVRHACTGQPPTQSPVWSMQCPLLGMLSLAALLGMHQLRLLV
jgi:hypothetical protein